MEDRLLALLKLALKYKATDIHLFESFGKLKIELRINGVCVKVKSKPGDEKLIRYLQYLANLDVGNILTPQTGQLEMVVNDNLLSLRFALINSINYSDGVLRILNQQLKVNANNLSTIDYQNKYFKSLLKKQCGLIIFSGPTGSGKTTTLYSLLKSVNDKKIYTLEDPVEVYQDNMVQLNINRAIGFDYQKGVAQILRHDPDIIMVGEIRDNKAAQIAVVAANTGHLVLTTLHAPSASRVIFRMEELGVNKQHLLENLICISNQRLLTGVDNQKMVIYEIMDLQEITYFKNNNKNSRNFISIEKQLKKKANDGLLFKTVV